jgi:hypothetical protein
MNQSTGGPATSAPSFSFAPTDEQMEQVEQAWEAITRIGECNADEDPDEILRVVTEVVEEVRQERYNR